MMHIGLCADENFALPFGVCLTSIFESNKDADFTVHVITQGFSGNTLAKIKATEERYHRPGSVKIYTIDDSIFAEYPLSKQFPKSIYFRYLFADVIPSEVGKLIYLDCDTVVLDNLQSLYDTHLSDSTLLAAVEDRNSDDIVIRNRIDRWDGTYFNSGVLLFNLKEWRKSGAFKAMSQFILRNPEKCLYPDQDAINAVFNERITPLPFRYNFLMSFVAPFSTFRLHKSKQQALEESANEIAVLHYAAETKPWYLDSKHPTLSFWQYFFQKSAWKDTKLKYRRPLLQRMASKLIVHFLYRDVANAVNQKVMEALEKCKKPYSL